MDGSSIESDAVALYVATTFQEERRAQPAGAWPGLPARAWPRSSTATAERLGAMADDEVAYRRAGALPPDLAVPCPRCLAPAGQPCRGARSALVADYAPTHLRIVEEA